MIYLKFYDIAEYGSEAWRGFFSKREIAYNAYEYKCAYDQSLENNEIHPVLKELMKLLKEDGSEKCMDWLNDIASSLDLNIDLDELDLK